ncbi:hypothetical protein [Lysinibacillus sp. NPDC056232]|uniref:hypothetical protein n=1 Tax=Lysinibacillus sp. NPDC056232 TaxID=3345756 RepID=UPI0035D65721
MKGIRIKYVGMNHFEYMEQQEQMTIFDLLLIQETMVQGELSSLNKCFIIY